MVLLTNMYNKIKQSNTPQAKKLIGAVDAGKQLAKPLLKTGQTIVNNYSKKPSYMDLKSYEFDEPTQPVDLIPNAQANNVGSIIPPNIQTPITPQTTTTTTLQAPTFDANQYYNNQSQGITDYTNKAKELELAQLNSARDKAIGDINLLKKDVAPAFQNKRNDADFQSRTAANRLREMMASQGLGNSGENISGQVAISAANQNALNSLNLEEQRQLADYDKQIRDLLDPSNEQNIISRIDLDQIRQLNDLRTRADDMAYDNSWKTYDANYRTGRDIVGDEQWGKTYDWGKTMDVANLTGNYNGKRTLQGQQLDISNRAQIAALTGVDPVTGKPTYEAIQNDKNLAVQVGQLTGNYGGKRTLQGQEYDQSVKNRKEDVAHRDKREKVADSQWDKSYALDKHNTYKKSSSGGGGGSKRTTQWQTELGIENKAMNVIKKRMGAFRTAKDFDAQLKKEVLQGKFDPVLYDVIHEYVGYNFDNSELPTWKGRKNPKKSQPKKLQPHSLFR